VPRWRLVRRRAGAAPDGRWRADLPALHRAGGAGLVRPGDALAPGLRSSRGGCAAGSALAGLSGAPALRQAAGSPGLSPVWRRRYGSRALLAPGHGGKSATGRRVHGAGERRTPGGEAATPALSAVAAAELQRISDRAPAGR